MKTKVEGIQKVATPVNKTELKSYLGMVSFYKYLHDHATILAPLTRVLREDETWSWGPEQAKAFEKSKELLQSPKVLVHYYPEKPLLLSCDALPYGVGAILSHEMPDGPERPIACSTRTPTTAERNYSQPDKEALVIIFAVKKHHLYLHGRWLIIFTDHKLLLGIFGPDRPVPLLVSARVQ